MVSKLLFTVRTMQQTLVYFLEYVNSGFAFSMHGGLAILRMEDMYPLSRSL